MQPKEQTHVLFGVNDFTMAASQTQRDLTEACMIRHDFKSCGKSLYTTLRVLQHFHKLFSCNFCRPSGSQDWHPIVYHNVSELHSYATSQFPVCLLLLAVADFSLYWVVWPVINNEHVWFFSWFKRVTLILFGRSVTALNAHPPLHSEQMRCKGNHGIALIWDWGLWWCLWDVSLQFQTFPFRSQECLILKCCMTPSGNI